MVKHQPLQVYERQLCLSCLTGIYGCRWKRYQRSHDDTTKGQEHLRTQTVMYIDSVLVGPGAFWDAGAYPALILRMLAEANGVSLTLSQDTKETGGETGADHCLRKGWVMCPGRQSEWRAEVIQGAVTTQSLDLALSYVLCHCQPMPSMEQSAKWEFLWSLILFFTFSLLLVWFYFWWEAHNDYNEFNWFLYNRSGEWSDGTVPILATTAAGFTYIAFLMILALCHIAVGQQLNLHWLHKIGVSTALLTTAIGFISVNQTWGEEWAVIPISLQATGPFLHLGALVAVTALAWLVAGQVARAEKTRFQVVVLLLYLSVLLGLYMAPLSITSPCIMDHANLKPRPDVIGHQGAPMLAPENTILSFQRALQMNVSGLEADVAISLDGVPFLMRDRTLRRTTDVGKVFPARQLDDVSSFNWTDLHSLNAGQWFLKDDPFWTVQSMAQREVMLVGNQSVCSLEQLLRLAALHNHTVVFNLRRPPHGHPCYHSWINDTLEVVRLSGIPQHLVMWTPDWDRGQVRQVAPGLQQTGISSVSSEAPNILKKVPYPIWLMSPDEYCLIWVAADLISFTVVIGIFVFQKKSSRDVNIMKEKLIFSEVSNGVGSAEDLYMENGFDYYNNEGISH
ncbi:unnamed protein product [Coregonus sp. 'balchen']|nr:unnamed protein product [Coregonus sp. 'balchen']